MDINEVLLIGVQGGFGRLMARLLADRGLRVTGVGRRPRDAGLEMLADYHQADALAVDPTYGNLIKSADCILLCLPDEPTKKAIPLVAAEMSAGALLCDVLSVKTHVAAVMQQQRDDIELVSLHPMFAPSVSFEGQNVVMVPVRTGPRAEEVRSWLIDWQSRVTEMSAADHDRTAALTQTATHAAVLVFGIVLRKLGYDPGDADSVSTPAHRSLLAQLARIADSDPEVYWKILHDNPNSAHVLNAAQQAIDELGSLAIEGSETQISDLLKSFRKMLGDDQARLFERSSKMFQLDVDERRTS